MWSNDEVVVVTGAGRNIGEAVVTAFVQKGARVAVVDIDSQRADKVAQELEHLREGSVISVACDVSSSGQVASMVDRVIHHFGRIDVLVNNVAITDRKTILELEEEEWDRVMDVTLKSVFLCSKFVAKQMIVRQIRGRIINVASTSGYRGRSNATAYTAAKAGILNLTRTMAVQLSRYGIRVNSVTPNKIGSPVGESDERKAGEVKNLIGRNGVPVDLARAITFLASKNAEFITGVDLLVDGGALAGLQ